QNLLEEHQGFEVQRRGVQSLERTQALSQRIAVDLSAPTPKGRVMNAETQGAYGNALTSITSQLDELLERSPTSLTDYDKLKIAELKASQTVAMKSLWGSVSETGRALNYWKATKLALESHDDRFIRAAMQIEGSDLGQTIDTLRSIKDPIA